MIRILPISKGYTADARLGQFRKVFKSGAIEFLEFDSEKGDRILTKYIKTLDVESAEFNQIATAIL